MERIEDPELVMKVLLEKLKYYLVDAINTTELLTTRVIPQVIQLKNAQIEDLKKKIEKLETKKE